MATAFVQSNHGTVSSGTLTVAFPSNVATGGLLVAYHTDGTTLNNTTNINTPTDTRTNTYLATDTMVHSPSASSTGPTNGKMFYAAGTTAGANTVSFTDVDGNFITGDIMELSGCATSSALDGSLHGSSTVGAAHSLASATLTGVPAGDIIVTCVSDYDGSAPADTCSAGFTVNTTGNTWDGSTFYRGGTAYQANVSAGNYTATWTLPNADTFDIIVFIAAFKPLAVVQDTPEIRGRSGLRAERQMRQLIAQ